MKKSICFIVILMFILTPSMIFADSKKLQYTLEEAFKVAVENNRQAKLDDFNIRTKEKLLKQIKDNGITGGYSVDSKASIVAYEIKIKIKPMQAELDLENAKSARQENLDNLGLAVLKQASGIFMSGKEIDKEKSKLENLNEKYKILIAKNKAGKITDDEIASMEWNINSKENNIKDLEENLKSAYLSFMKLLNLPLDGAQISIDYANEYKTFAISDIDSYISRAINSSIDIYNKQQNLLIQQDILDITGKHYNPGEYEYDSENLNLENAKSDLEDSKQNIEMDVKNRYNNLLSQKDRVDLSDSFLKMMEKKLNNAQLKFKKGLVSKEALLSAKDNFLDAVFQKEVAIKNYNIMKAELENLVM